MSLNITRYQENDPFFVQNADRLNRALLQKMLAQGFLQSIRTSSERNLYQFTGDDDILLLPGEWDSKKFLSKEGCVIKGIERTINGVKVGDKLFVLAASSIITNLELKGDQQNVQTSAEKDTVMKNDAVSIINGSATTINVSRGSDFWSLTKEQNAPGNFNRIDLDSTDYDLEPGVWDEYPNGERIRGAYSSLFCILSFPDAGQYRLQIQNNSDLYNFHGMKFDLELKYNIQVI